MWRHSLVVGKCRGPVVVNKQAGSVCPHCFIIAKKQVALSVLDFIAAWLDGAGEHLVEISKMIVCDLH